MNPIDPRDNPLIPAVQHLEDTLGADAQGVQRIADKLVGAVGDSLISDKNYLQKRVKARLPRMVGNSIRRDERVINDIAGRLRQAVASSLVSDAERVDQIAARLQSAGLSVPVTSAPTASTVTATSPTGPTGAQATFCFVIPVGDAQSGQSVYANNSGVKPPPLPGWFGGDPCDWIWHPEYRLWIWSCYNPNNGRWVYQICAGLPPATSPPTNVPPPTLPPAPPPTVVPPPGVPPTLPPVTPPTPAVDACGPLPEGLPGVAVYVVPWLDPGDHAASYLSECGTKLIRERQWTTKDANRLAEALVSMYALDEWLPPAPDGPLPPIPYTSDDGSSSGGSNLGPPIGLGE